MTEAQQLRKRVRNKSQKNGLLWGNMKIQTKLVIFNLPLVIDSL